MAYQTFTHQIWWVMVCYDLAHQIRCAKHTFSGWCDIPPMVCCSFGGHSTPQFLQCTWARNCTRASSRCALAVWASFTISSLASSRFPTHTKRGTGTVPTAHLHLSSPHRQISSGQYSHTQGQQASYLSKKLVFLLFCAILL